MKESAIRKLAIAELGQDGWHCWFAPKAKFRESDIFGIADLICSKSAGIKLIQLTTLSNVSARRKKIGKVLERMELGCLIEIWGYDKKKKIFKKIRIN
jgi:hypothetical protein